MTIEELATATDEAFHYDTYEYNDCDMNYEKTLEMIRNNPYGVIEILARIINEMND